MGLASSAFPLGSGFALFGEQIELLAFNVPPFDAAGALLGIEVAGLFEWILSAVAGVTFPGSLACKYKFGGS